VGSYEHKNGGMHSVMMMMMMMVVVVVVIMMIMIMIMMIENFQPAEWLLASQGVCSMNLVISTNTEIQLHSTSQLIKFVHQEFWSMFHTNVLYSPLIYINSHLVRWVSGFCSIQTKIKLSLRLINHHIIKMYA